MTMCTNMWGPVSLRKRGCMLRCIFTHDSHSRYISPSQAATIFDAYAETRHHHHHHHYHHRKLPQKETKPRPWNSACIVAVPHTKSTHTHIWDHLCFYLVSLAAEHTRLKRKRKGEGGKNGGLYIYVAPRGSHVFATSTFATGTIRLLFAVSSVIVAVITVIIITVCSDKKTG